MDGNEAARWRPGGSVGDAEVHLEEVVCRRDGLIVAQPGDLPSTRTPFKIKLVPALPRSAIDGDSIDFYLLL